MTGLPHQVQASPTRAKSLSLPETVPPVRVRWHYAGSIVFLHLVALLACLPWFFSWTGVVVCVMGFYVFGTLGINLCYHRLLTHRSFKCPLWMERALVILGLCCL